MPAGGAASAAAAPDITYAVLWSPEQFDAAYARSETAKDDIKIIRQFFAVRVVVFMKKVGKCPLAVCIYGTLCYALRLATAVAVPVPWRSWSVGLSLSYIESRPMHLIAIFESLLLRVFILPVITPSQLRQDRAKIEEEYGRAMTKLAANYVAPNSPKSECVSALIFLILVSFLTQCIFPSTRTLLSYFPLQLSFPILPSFSHPLQRDPRSFAENWAHIHISADTIGQRHLLMAATLNTECIPKLKGIKDEQKSRAQEMRSAHAASLKVGQIRFVAS